MYSRSAKALPPLEHFKNLDHHHNMVHRLGALPPTYRGNRVRKNVAYQNLQGLINPDVFDNCDTNCSALSALDLITSKKYNRNRCFYMLFMDRYVMVSALRLVDCLVGGDTSDHTPAKAEKIEKIKSQFDRFKADKIMNASAASDDMLEVTMVKEIMSQITTKWDVLRQRRQNFVASEDMDEEEN